MKECSLKNSWKLQGVRLGYMGGGGGVNDTWGGILVGVSNWVGPPVLLPDPRHSW